MNLNEQSLDKVFRGFSKLCFQERLQVLVRAGLLAEEGSEYLQQGGLRDISLGEKFIENVIGYFQLPLGVAVHFRIDGIDRLIPMAVEETSIIAAASKTAKWIRESGHITTRSSGANIIGQIQIGKIKNLERLRSALQAHENYWVQMANREVAFGLVQRGGGVKSIELRVLQRPDGLEMGVLHVLMDPCEAMGANLVNQVCEYLKTPIEVATGESVTMCILSNLADTKLTTAEIVLENIDAEVAEKIEEASLFAELDPYRAATNNKGVLNGMDPILIATGNDWRAVESGVHAFACKDGRYRSITRWQRNGKALVGTLQAPIVVGTVGGVTTLHPTASLCMRILGVTGAQDLARVVAAVGLTQNLGALRALVTDGIIEGHMRLHIKNLSLGAGANEIEMPVLQKKLEAILSARKRISLSQAIDALTELRAQRGHAENSEILQ